jgi:GDP-L-fucose synthase
MELNDKIYIAGHNGMVGSAVERRLRKEGYKNIVTLSSSDLDLRNQKSVNDFFKKEKPNYVILSAAKVGGIYANNTFRAEFIYDNLMIEANVINAAYLNGTIKLLFLGSSCIYPKDAHQPIKEEYLLSGNLESTNEPYAIAKIAGIKMIESYARQYGCKFTAIMPTNLYGPNDNYDLNNSHVLPALLSKIHYAKMNKKGSVEVWGTGKPLREFMHVDDLADACLFILNNYESWKFLNVGSGEEISIENLALLIKNIVGYEGVLYFNSEMPDGTYRKLMDSSKINKLGWYSKISLEEGIRGVYKDFLKSKI